MKRYLFILGGVLVVLGLSVFSMSIYERQGSDRSDIREQERSQGTSQIYQSEEGRPEKIDAWGVYDDKDRHLEFSFQYPEGWVVTQGGDASVVELWSPDKQIEKKAWEDTKGAGEGPPPDIVIVKYANRSDLPNNAESMGLEQYLRESGFFSDIAEVSISGGPAWFVVENGSFIPSYGIYTEHGGNIYQISFYSPFDVPMSSDRMSTIEKSFVRSFWFVD